MPRSPRRSAPAAILAAGSLIAAGLLVVAGCSSHRPGATGPAPTAGEIFRSLLGINSGLTSLRAVAETRISFAGHGVSLPGVLRLDSFGGFRLDLLDPLDRTVAVLFADAGRIVHYRPGPGLAASLGVFPGECRGVDPADWVSAILAASLGPIAGESLADRVIWGGGRVLERHRGNELYQSIRYQNSDGRLLPRELSWYCDEDVVLLVKVREWLQGSSWRLPTVVGIEYPRAGLAITIELSEIETNPPPTSQPLRPRLGSEIRWTTWNLPQ